MIELRNELRELYGLIGRNIAGTPPPDRASEPRRASGPQAPTPAPDATVGPSAPAEAETLPVDDLPLVPERPSAEPASPVFTLAGLRRPVSLASLDVAPAAGSSEAEDRRTADATPRARAPASGQPGQTAGPTPGDPRRDTPSRPSGEAEPVSATLFARAQDARSDGAPSPDNLPPRGDVLVGEDGLAPSSPATARATPGILPLDGSLATRDRLAASAGSVAGDERTVSAGRMAASTADATVTPGNPLPSPATASSAARDAARSVEGVALLRDIDGFLQRAGLGDAPAGQAQVERAGVIASFILNAAMIPGWPPPRPIEPANFARQVPLPAAMPSLGADEMEAGLLLARVLGDPAKVAALLAALATQRRRRKILALLSLLATQTRALLDLWASELGVLPRPEAAPPRRERLVLR